ncbi:MAG: NADP-dependent oxidoreductase [Sphingomonas taxi]
MAMIPDRQRQWTVAARPARRALADGDFALVEAPVGRPAPGQVLLRATLLEFAPAQKSWMENAAAYRHPVEIGGVMPGNGAGEVVASADPRFAVGDVVAGPIGWQEFPLVDADELRAVPAGVAPAAALSTLGTSGRTAYAGLFLVGEVKAGDTVLVSGAAGAVGTLVGQMARLAGARTIGIAGGADKCDWIVREVGYDAAIDYRGGEVKRRLRELAPGGVDVMFDNVGGEVLNDALARLAPGARVVICGGIARYNHDPRDRAAMPEGPRNYFNLVATGSRMQGFVVYQYRHRFAEIDRRLAGWLRAGRLVPHEDMQAGFENAPATLRRLFEGANRGKQLLRIGD